MRVGRLHAAHRTPANPFRYFNSSPEAIRLVVLMYVRLPLSLRNVEDLLFARRIDVCREMVRLKKALERHGSHEAITILKTRVQRVESGSL